MKCAFKAKLPQEEQHSDAEEENLDDESLLFPFAEATDLTEGEKMVTVSMVVPTVLDLNTHLLQISEILWDLCENQNG